MKEKIFLIMLGMFLFSIAFAQPSVNPTSWSLELSKGSFSCKQFTITNLDNFTRTFDISSEGTIYDLITFDTNFLAIDSGQSKSFKACLNAISTGTYTGNINIKYDSSYLKIPVELEVQEVQEVGGYLTPVIRVYDRYLKQGEISGFSVKFRNLGDKPVQLSTVDTGGATKEFFRVEYDLPNELRPGEELEIKVTFDATKVEPKDYQTYLILVGFVENQRVEGRIDFNIHVLTGVAQPVSPTTQGLEINFAKEAVVGEIYTINVTGVESTDYVSVDITPFKDIKLVESNIQGSTWYAKYVFNQSGNYVVAVKVYKHGALALSKSDEVFVSSFPSGKCNLLVDFEPEKPKAGDKLRIVSVTVKETEEDVTLQSKILINNQEYKIGKEIPLETGKDYTIDVYYGKCQSFHYKISIPKKLMYLRYDKPVVGKFISIQAFDAETNAPLASAEINVNNQTFTGLAKVLVGNDTLDIEAKEDEHESVKQIIVPIPALEAVQKNVEMFEGESKEITLNREGDWQIVDESKKVILSGTSMSVQISNLKSGTYYLIGEGETLATIHVKSRLFTIYILVGLFVILVLLLIVYFRKRRSGAIHFQTEPISSQFELEE
jgi:hypothetical protein